MYTYRGGGGRDQRVQLMMEYTEYVYCMKTVTSEQLHKLYIIIIYDSQIYISTACMICSLNFVHTELHIGHKGVAKL